MKKIKFILPVLAFTFAIAAAFATQATKTVLTEFAPNHYDDSSGIECPTCAIPDEPGNEYGVDYGCDTEISGPLCECVLEDETTTVDATSPFIAECELLHRYEK